MFEWDAGKRSANSAKQGLDLIDAVALFDGRSVFTYPSPRGDESRFVTVGIISGVFVALVWTERGGNIRLISLRRARNGEKQGYRARFG